MNGELRLGILSTAAINSPAILDVVGRARGVILQAVASRSPETAGAYANRHGIPQAYGSYEELLEQPYIDAVYISLPNSMHAEWARRALEAGKHVLCEKPMATSEREARALVRAQEKSGRVLMEALHYRYHPVAREAAAILRRGELGEVEEVQASFCTWLPGDRHIRYSQALKGGALLDLGCYTVDAVRWMAGCDGARVTSASMHRMHTGVDHTARAEVEFTNGVRARVWATFRHLLPLELRARGSRGSLRVLSPFMPVAPLGPRLRLPLSQTWVRRGPLPLPRPAPPSDTSYYYQLCAFRDTITGGGTPETSARSCLANTRILDSIRRKAGGKP